MCENLSNCNSNKNKLQYMFGAAIGFSLPTSNEIINEYLLLPYHSSNTHDNNFYTAPLKPTSTTVDGFNTLQISIPITYNQTIRTVFISVGEYPYRGVYDKDIIIKIYIYVLSNPLSIATTTGIFITSIKLKANTLFAN